MRAFHWLNMFFEEEQEDNKKSRTAEDDRANCITKSLFVDHHNLQFLRIKSSGQESSFSCLIVDDSTIVANTIGAFKWDICLCFGVRQSGQYKMTAASQ